ncbi:ester cyclase [Rhizohabitans arisaemae]|uniref:ester cyclase n=1 Tax=Rhizohabitans arisaemae TaxID=2720610 RepID=UPI0024B25140|nr:nuclear transport factor 2 family protein [Rhizohabitans arisaemae]
MTEARRVRDRYLAAFNDHDISALLATFSPTGVVVRPEGTAEGPEEFASHIAEYWAAFPDCRLVVWEAFGAGETAVEEVSFAGTHTAPYLLPSGEVLAPTGRTVYVRGCNVSTVEDGLVISMRLYYDQLELFSQLGVPCLPST